MALRTPPSWLQNGSHPAENDRLTTQGLVPATGVMGANSLFVTGPGTGMTVSVGAGWGAILSSTALAGVYQIYNDAATTLSITTADVTNPRIDRVVATVSDSYYSGVSNTVAFQVIAGTPAASPAAPATPSNSISLATVAVAAGATTISQGNVTDTRQQIASTLAEANYYVLTANRSLTAASTADQNIFGVSFTGAANTTYQFEVDCVLSVTTNSAVANSVNAKVNYTLGSLTSIDGYTLSGTPSGTAVAGFANILTGVPASGTAYTIPATAATYNIPILIRGVLRTNTAGSGVFAASIAMTGTNTSTITVNRGATVKMNLLGPTSSNSVGAWA
jgi:hypothetical protein